MLRLFAYWSSLVCAFFCEGGSVMLRTTSCLAILVVLFGGGVFGSDEDGDPIALLGKGAQDRLVWGPTYVLKGAGSTYHPYKLVFDPGAGSAHFLVDATQHLSDYTGVSADTKRMFWGRD